jgi:hypothetical protein
MLFSAIGRTRRRLRHAASLFGGPHHFPLWRKRVRGSLAEMREDLTKQPLVRQFILLSKKVTHNGGRSPLFIYYYEDHDYLPSLMTIMQHAGAIHDAAFNDVPRYNFTEEFVSYLVGNT